MKEMRFMQRSDFTEDDGLRAGELEANLVKWAVILLKVMQQVC